jgi:hypothetical protein
VIARRPLIPSTPMESGNRRALPLSLAWIGAGTLLLMLGVAVIGAFIVFYYCLATSFAPYLARNASTI